MPTPTLYMSLPNPTPGGDTGVWANDLQSCITSIDPLAVNNFASVSASGALTVYNGPALIQVTTGSSVITLTLPDVTNGGANAKNQGRVYAIVKVDSGSGSIAINPFSGGQTISGQATLSVGLQWGGYVIQSTAAGWVVIGILDASVSGIVPVSEGGTGANLSATGGASNVVLQTAVGGVFTVRQLTALDLSNGTTGTTSVVLATSPTISGATLSGAITVSGTATFTTANPTFFSQTGSGAVVLATSPTISGPTISGTSSVTGALTYTTANPTFFSSTGSGAVVLAASPTITGTTHIGRLAYDQGTAYSGADSAIVPSVGWGTGATVSGAVGTDSALQFQINSGTASFGTDPTIVVTFKDGAFTNAPLILCQQTGGTLSANVAIVLATTSTTTATITWKSVPQVSQGYIFTMFLRGTN